jgi:TolB protein
MSLRKVFFLAAFATLLIANSASARIYIPIDQPPDQKFPIAISDLAKIGGGGSAGKKIPDIIRNDLELSGYFRIIPKRAYLERSRKFAIDEIDFKKWTMVGAKALVKGVIKKEEGRFVVQMKLFDPVDREMLVGKQYTFEVKDIRKIAHRFADEIMLSLTGIRGVFGTRIAYIKAIKKRRKSVYIMDMDGANDKRITKDKSISLGPTWSPDGTKISYASYVRGFPDIYTLDLASGHMRQLTNNRATNITPAWSPVGSWIAYASSLPGNMEIYAISPSGSNNRRLTNSFGIDIAPSFSPDGNEFVYTSERGGHVHIYKQSLLTGKHQRLTFVGSHNDSPDWSPDGQKVTFCGRHGGVFDIFTVNIDGSNVERLTIGVGDNEHPRWSPDGRFIVYSSTRFGKPKIIMMRYDGANQVQLGKKGYGMMPDWGPWED